MFKFLKKLIPKEERKLFDVTVKPFIIYSIANTVLIFLATKNFGCLNEDVAYGLCVSWTIYVFTYLSTTALAE